MEDYTYEKNSVDASMHLGTQCHRTNRNTHAAPRCRHSGCRNHGNIRKPDYICISTNSGREQLIMDGTKFTMTVGSKRHVTDSRKNNQFTTFHSVLKAVINNQPIPSGDDIAVAVKNGKKIITITPAKKRRQMFTSFVLTIDSATSAIKQLRMNERSGNYVNYDIK